MKNKQLICWILSAMTALGMLAGCQTEQPVNTDPAGSSTPAQTQAPETVPETSAGTPAPSSSATVLSAEEDAKLHADLQARINEILNTETEIVHSDTYIPGETYTGTAYYFSSDSQQHLCPAWRQTVRLLLDVG